MRWWKDRVRGLAAGAAALVAALAQMVWGAAPATAGGPTSVLLVSPESEQTAALYYSDKGYAALERLLGPLGQGTRDKPPEADLVSSRLINVSWMVHDVDPWRIDRVYVMAEGKAVWIHTAGKLTGAPTGAWHRAEHPSELRALLKSLGLMGEKASTGSGSAVYPAPWETAATPTPAEEAPDQGREEAAASAARSAGDGTGWWWAIPGAAAGVALGLVVRPRMDRLPSIRRRREPPEPRQELLDL
ncbi:hypothetical protein [Streptomyces thermocarboxydovorans]|uniref:hypothetical protein n=1 Tax=Streptomyces thermocarboxydovorans TaxID=59298 RepID=UPI0031D779DE